MVEFTIVRPVGTGGKDAADATPNKAAPKLKAKFMNILNVL